MSQTPNSQQEARNRLARRIKGLRLVRSLTQEKLAQRAGLAPRHLQKIEAAEVNVTLASLVRLAEALGVDICQLFLDIPD
jgi:transcriptional regulator with XRE-family HTH domain